MLPSVIPLAEVALPGVADLGVERHVLLRVGLEIGPPDDSRVLLRHVLVVVRLCVVRLTGGVAHVALLS